jgi:hypothetical protein
MDEGTEWGWRCEKNLSLRDILQSHSHSRLESIFFSFSWVTKQSRPAYFFNHHHFLHDVIVPMTWINRVEEAQEKKWKKLLERYKLSLISNSFFSFIFHFQMMMMWGWYKFFNMCHTHLFLTHSFTFSCHHYQVQFFF